MLATWPRQCHDGAEERALIARSGSVERGLDDDKTEYWKVTELVRVDLRYPRVQLNGRSQ